MKSTQQINREWHKLLDNVAANGLQVTPDDTRNALRVLLTERGWEIPVSLVEIEPIDGQTRCARLKVDGTELVVKFQGDGGFSHAMLEEESSLHGLRRRGELRRLYDDERGLSEQLLSILQSLHPATEKQWAMVLKAIADAPRQTSEDYRGKPWYELTPDELLLWARGTHPTHQLNCREIGDLGY